MESSKLKNRVGGPVEDESRLNRSSSSFRFLTPETTGSEDHSDGSVSSFLWPNFLSSNDHTTQSARCFSSNCADNIEETSEEKDGSSTSGSVDDLAEMEMEIVKERLSKLLLGEDMSGSGNGVSTALAISNAITNLCASVFGQLWRLEPLPQIKKYMWKREMECLLCVTDYIAELKPSWHAYPDGSKIEVMSRIPRADLSLNLPALRKLDNMLLAILDCFNDTEFWYVEHGLASADLNVLSSFRKGLKRQEEKWWMPVPQVPPCGLSHETRKKLQKQRECSNQILKAVAATNSITLADMEIPKSYLDGLPKTGKACLGDIMYRNLTSQNFSSNSLLAGLGISSEHKALEIANQVEAAIFVWRKRTNSKDIKRSNQRSSSRDSWEMVKDFVQDTEKKELLADRAECFLLCLKQQFPGLSQTMLDASKIQYNKDVGKSILESYSRVLESLAFNIVALIDDILYVDDMNKQSGQKKKFLTQRFAHLVTEPNRRTTPEFSFQK